MHIGLWSATSSSMLPVCTVLRTTSRPTTSSSYSHSTTTTTIDLVVVLLLLVVDFLFLRIFLKYVRYFLIAFLVSTNDLFCH
jgi:hypothetical protein